MKRFLTALLALALIASLCACAAETDTAETDAPEETPSIEEAEEPETSSEEAETPPEEPETPSEEAETPSGEAEPETPEENEPEETEPEETPASETTAPAASTAPTSAATTSTTPASTTPASTTTTATAPAASTAPAETQTPAAVETPSEEAPAGAHTEETADGLTYVQADGTLLRSAAFGYLYFGADGLYTCGDATLDQQVRDLIASAVSDPEAAAETRLKELYNYIIAHYAYLGLDHYQAGTTDWLNEAAAFMLKNGKSNCYGFSAVFCLGARQLGYQAYVVAGHEYSTTNEHAWVMINWPDGAVYLFDPELECAHPSEKMFKVSTKDGVWYAGHPYYFP